MKKIQLQLAVLGSVIAAGLHRHCNPDAVALGNADENPNSPEEASEGEKTPKKLAAENAALKKQIAGNESREKQIREKMAAGLTREQAEASIQHQADFTARKAKVDAEKKESAEKKEAARK